MQPDYAPELNVVGVAEGGVPVDVGNVYGIVNGGLFSGIGLAAGIGLARSFPDLIDLSSLLNAQGVQMRDDISTRCVADYVVQYAFQPMEQYTVGNVDPLTLPAVQTAIARDTLGRGVPSAPLFIYQGNNSGNDGLLPYDDVANLARFYCSNGAKVDFVESLIDDHFTLAVTGAGAALSYLIARFDQEPAPDTCANGPVVDATPLLQPASNLVTTLTSAAGLVGFF